MKRDDLSDRSIGRIRNLSVDPGFGVSSTGAPWAVMAEIDMQQILLGTT